MVNIFRPDVVIFLPEKRNIIIDSKLPMKDWYDYFKILMMKIKSKGNL